MHPDPHLMLLSALCAFHKVDVLFSDASDATVLIPSFSFHRTYYNVASSWYWFVHLLIIWLHQKKNDPSKASSYSSSQYICQALMIYITFIMSYILPSVCVCVCVCVCVLVAQSCPTLCDPINCSPPGSSVLGISQTRILEWVAFPFSRRSSQPRERTQVSHIAGRIFTVWVAKEAHINPLNLLRWKFLFSSLSYR